jgi:uncharacterized membrane protein YqhA
MKKEGWKFLGALLIALLLLLAFLGGYAWYVRKNKITESEKKPVVVCGRAINV